MHNFSTSEKRPQKKALPPVPRPAPTLEQFDAQQTQKLCLLVRDVMRGCEALQDFVITNRELARDGGIESLMIEITAICEGTRMERLVDSLENAMAAEEPISITTEGLGRIRRIEALLAEASRNINRYTTASVDLGSSSRSTWKMSQPQAKTTSNDALMTGFLVALGAVVLTVAIVYASKQT